MGLFIALKLTEQDLNNIAQFQQANNIKNPVMKEDIHCTLFSTADNFEYMSTLELPIEVNALTLGNIKTQSGVDCLVLYFKNQQLSQYYDFIKDKYNVTPFYPQFIPHITLSYDCGDLDLSTIHLEEYLSGITFTKEYTQELKFETNHRKIVRS